MDRASYAAASGGLLQLRRLDIATNNLANVNTTGYRKQILVTRSQDFQETFAQQFAAQDPFAKGDHQRVTPAVHVQEMTDFSPGSIRSTSNPLDVALNHPNDFFAVNGSDGQVEYTRSGSFTLNAQGELVTQDGRTVQSDGGAPITIAGSSATIQPSGAVMSSNQLAGNIQVVRIEDTSRLIRAGNASFTLPAGAAAEPNPNPDLITGSLEQANVSIITSMVELISTSRAFDMYNKTAQSIDQTNQTAIERYGRTT